ncbi:hypothetical protein C0995_009299 [Termitomyces sp. Mi166|nr:hypothetical protein C0995_009299 [Termitomyces sp. Mi166\
MQLPNLPQELVDQIIEHLHGDPPTLKCCALVCRAWLSPSRSQIFHRITLEPREPSKLFGLFAWRRKSALRSLVDTMKASPDIAPYIQEVEIVEGVGVNEWIGNEPLLFFLLALLKHVKRFRLRHSAAIPIVWRALSPEFKIALLQFLASPSLCEINLGMLRFTNAEVFKLLLRRSSHLRVLHLDHIHITESANYPSATPDNAIFQSTSQAPLDTLVLGARNSSPVIEYFLQPESTIDVTSLRNLSISMSANFEVFGRLLQSVIGLESLEILLMSDADLVAYRELPLSERLDLSHNPYIIKLSVKIDVIQCKEDPLPWLNSLFSTFTAPNKLRVVHVVYSLYLPSPYMDRSMNTMIFSKWQEIDATLTGPIFDSLKEVRLVFSLENPIGFGVAPRFLKEVDLPSPALRASNRLVVEAFDTSR